MKKWEILHKAKSTKQKAVLDILLANRGLKTKKEKIEFLNPTPPEEIGVKALGISQLETNKAIKRIKIAKESKEKVIVYGDYDADGICATAILWETLFSLGLNVLPYIPERFSEGYGLNSESIQKLKKESPDLKLIITVDHGIVAGEKVDFAKDLGIDVIITDHHTPGKIRPKAYATVHTTKVGGAAVAWIFSREIAKSIKHSSNTVKQSLELATIGTIADQLPLVGVNRSIVKFGLLALSKTKRIGLIELMRTAGLVVGEDKRSVYDVGFLIAPRLNAAGRMEHAIESLRLLCTKDPLKARRLANHLNTINLDRQRVVDEVVAHAERQVQKLNKIIILAHESYHEGVIGLAAGKLVEKYYKPAIVFSKKGKISKASARSISGFNIIEAIRNLDSLLIEGGGHPMAAGFSIETSSLEIFTKKITQVADKVLTDDILTRKAKIDLELEFDQINLEFLRLILKLEPFGYGNPTPVFLTEKVEVIESRLVGRDGKHLKLTLRKEDTTHGAIAFGLGETRKSDLSGKLADIVYTVEENVWNGHTSLQLRIKDIRIQKE